MSEDKLLQFTESKSMYARFIKEDDTSSDIFSDVESTGGSDFEALAEECEREDDQCAIFWCAYNNHFEHCFDITNTNYQTTD